MKTKSFTLIELIVVIAMIGILLTVLVPSLTKAKEASMSAVCSSNLAQSGRAIFSYSKEWNLYLPAYDGIGKSNGGADASDWKLMLFPYLGFSKEKDKADPIFSCPLEKITGINEKYAGGLAYTKAAGRYKKATQVQILQISEPAETLLMSDTIDWPNHSKQVKALLYPSDNGPNGIPIGDRHNKGINILWSDMSVSWMTQNSMRAGKNGLIDFYYLIEKQ